MHKNLRNFLHLLIPAAIAWLVFNAVFFLGTHPSRIIHDGAQQLFALLWTRLPDSDLRDFLVYGLFTGIFGFLVYVPNIACMFLFTHLLQKSGVTDRMAALADPFLRRFGLTGWSFPPLLLGFGCSVGAIQGAQFVNDQRQRRITMFISPFMSCGSKFAVYVLVIGAVFPAVLAGSILFSLYAIGLAFGLLTASLLRRMKHIDTSAESFLPLPPESPLHLPPLPPVVRATLKDTLLFVAKAGSVIVVANCILWAAAFYPGYPRERYAAQTAAAAAEGYSMPSRMTMSLHTSYLSRFGHAVEPLVKPFGQDWKQAVALVGSVAGRGIIVSTLATLYGIEHGPTSTETLVCALQADKAFSPVSGYAMILFVLLCGGCLASVTLFYAENRSSVKTTFFMVWPIGVAWCCATIFYQTARLLGYT